MRPCECGAILWCIDVRVRVRVRVRARVHVRVHVRVRVRVRVHVCMVVQKLRYPTVELRAFYTALGAAAGVWLWQDLGDAAAHVAC